MSRNGEATQFIIQSPETDSSLEGRPQHENAREVGGVTRVTISTNGDATTHQGTHSVTAEDLREHKQGILSTARTRSQMPARELTPDTLVTFGGMQISLRDAEANGFVRRDDQGRYQEVSNASASSQSEQQQQQAKQQQEQQQADKQDPQEIQPEQFAPKIEQELGELTKAVPGEVLGPVFHDVAMQIFDEGDINIEAVASRTGLSVEQSRRALELAYDGYRAQADNAAKKAGVSDVQAFYDWIAVNRPEQGRRAMSQLVMGRTAAGYAPLAQEYLRSVVPSADSLK